MGKNATMAIPTSHRYHGTCTPPGDHTTMITQNRNSEERISTAAPRPPSTSCSKSSPVAGSDHATLRRTDHMRPSTPATVLAPTPSLSHIGGGCAEGLAPPVRPDGPVLEVDALRFRQREDDEAGQQAEYDAVPDERAGHVPAGEVGLEVGRGAAEDRDGDRGRHREPDRADPRREDLGVDGGPDRGEAAEEHQRDRHRDEQ